MKPSAIIYTSKTGHTRQYALLLGKEIGLPVYSYDESVSQLPGGSNVIYMGWIHASHVKGFSGAAKRFSVSPVRENDSMRFGSAKSTWRIAANDPASSGRSPAP